MSLRLLSASMDDDGLYYRRQGFWLRMARERAGKNQQGAAIEIGLAASSKSTISDYETGAQIAPQPVLRKLARWYGVPVEMFTHPQPSAGELIEQAIREASQSGASAERADWEAGLQQDPVAEAEPDDEPGRRSA